MSPCQSTKEEKEKNTTWKPKNSNGKLPMTKTQSQFSPGRIQNFKNWDL